MRRIAAQGLTDGHAEGILALLVMPLSLWGGLELATGCISDTTHPQQGQCIAGHILAMRSARGSSSSASALVEAARRRTAPAAIVLTRADPILVIGSLVAADLYRQQIPIITIDSQDWPVLCNGASVCVRSGEGRAELIIDA